MKVVGKKEKVRKVNKQRKTKVLRRAARLGAFLMLKCMHMDGKRYFKIV